MFVFADISAESRQPLFVIANLEKIFNFYKLQTIKQK